MDKRLILLVDLLGLEPGTNGIRDQHSGRLRQNATFIPEDAFEIRKKHRPSTYLHYVYTKNLIETGFM